MEKFQLVELKLQSGEKLVVNVSEILTVKPSVEGCHVIIAGDSHFKIVTEPSYQELAKHIASNVKE